MRAKSILRKNVQSGFTLMELMMAVMIFTIAAVSSMGVYMGSTQLNESNRNSTRAVADARAVLEGIRETSATGLSAVTSTNWTAWAAANGLSALQNETVTVTYSNPLADPLPVSVQIGYQERGRAKSTVVDTFVTRR